MDTNEAYYPDGLTSEVIDALLSEAAVAWSMAPRPTSRLLDDTAELRRERRAARRGIGAVVRVLPTRPRSSVSPAGEVA
ncbi:MAG: hypothetical protein WBA97_09880 [Actinophytocola sp.]|uniref:hypothetical protein n=1 Tax=Actinophytocola sp. TaxID=1872138 RepID=UPI003C70D781